MVCGTCGVGVLCLCAAFRIENQYNFPEPMIATSWKSVKWEQIKFIVDYCTTLRNYIRWKLQWHSSINSIQITHTHTRTLSNTYGEKRRGWHSFLLKTCAKSVRNHDWNHITIFRNSWLHTRSSTRITSNVKGKKRRWSETKTNIYDFHILQIEIIYILFRLTKAAAAKAAASATMYAEWRVGKKKKKREVVDNTTNGR